MFRHKRWMWGGSVVVAVLAVMFVAVPDAYSKKKKRKTVSLPLSAGAVIVTGGGTATPSGFRPTLVLDNSGNPGCGWSFTVPKDYRPGTPLVVEFLWNTESTNCTVVVRSNYVHVATVGEDGLLGGSSAGGLSGLDADTLFVENGTGLAIDAPAQAGDVAVFRFQIDAESSHYGALQRGSVVTFGIFRFSSNVADTCAGDLNIAGARIVYQKKGR